MVLIRVTKFDMHTYRAQVLIRYQFTSLFRKFTLTGFGYGGALLSKRVLDRSIDNLNSDFSFS